MHIFVVDDRHDVCNIIATCLREEGHDVVEANDAEAAICSLPGCDAVICDVRMPGSSGLNVAEACDRKNVPVLLCTGDLFAAEELAQLGVRHLAKPFPITALTTWLDELAPFPDGLLNCRSPSVASLTY